MDYKKLVKIADGRDSVDSIAEKLNSGKMSLAAARKKLYRCGEFDELPTVSECIDYLDDNSEEGVDTIEVVKRELEPMLAKVGLSLEWEMDGTHMIYNKDGKIVSPVEFYEDNAEDYGEDNVVMANDEQDALLMSEQFNELYEQLI